MTTPDFGLHYEVMFNSNKAKCRYQKSRQIITISTFEFPVFLVDIFTPTLGSLSAKYETGGRGSGTINNYKKGASGDPGGASYGTYQIATKTGTMKGFLKFLNEKDTKMAEKLNSLTPGTDEFDEEWKNLANKEEFGTFQHDFIKSTHYDKTLSKLSTNYKLDMNLDQRSSVIKDVIWSTSVQHGPSGAAKVINNAL
ncbi:unnamed protein product, partial [Rotaria magnacalcarata]